MARIGQILLHKSTQQILGQSIYSPFTRCYSASRKLVNNAPTASSRIESVGKSLASKGFLRPHKPYTPPEDVLKRIQKICSNLKISNKPDYKLTNLEEKFSVLNACFADFKHGVPNSQVHEISTIDDIANFYNTPVDTTVPFDALKTMDLPPNLHIQYEYLRFNPETDTKFDGQTAFPKSSTLVTGLRYRNKYPGHIVKRTFP